MFIQTELEEQGLSSLHSSLSVCKDRRYMVVKETLSKMLQLGDQRLCQIGRRIKGLKNGDINKQHILGSFRFEYGNEYEYEF